MWQPESRGNAFPLMNAAACERMTTAVVGAAPMPSNLTSSLALPISTPISTITSIPTQFAMPQNPQLVYPQSTSLSHPLFQMAQELPPPDVLPNDATRAIPLPIHLQADSENEQSAAWDRYLRTLSFKNRAAAPPVALEEAAAGTDKRDMDQETGKASAVLAANEFSMQWIGPAADVVVPLKSPALPLRLKNNEETDIL